MNLSKAMVKTMLQSPTVDANGYATAFSSQDFIALRAAGSLRSQATEANGWMQEAEQFLAAYGTRISAMDKNKLLSSFDVRAVLFVHGKKSETRTNFSSFVAIGQQFHLECKQLDPKIPQWIKLPIGEPFPKAAAPSTGALREFSMSTASAAPDSLLFEAGFQVGKIVIHKTTKEEYKVHSMSKSETLTLKKITADEAAIDAIASAADPKAAKAGKKDKKDKKAAKAAEAELGTIEVPRLELLKGEDWTVSKQVKRQFCTSSPSPLDHKEFKNAILTGLTKQAMASEFAKSSEAHCVVQTSPDLRLFATKAFKPGALKLVGMTTQVGVYADTKPGWKMMGDVGEKHKLLCRSSNVLTAGSSADREMFLSKFWTARESYNQNEVNCELVSKEVDLKMIDTVVNVSIPMLSNTRAIAGEEEIVVLKIDIKDSSQEPAQKKVKKTKR